MVQFSAKRKLAALEVDDLCVISAHVQDAQVNIGDIIWRQREKRLVVGMRRLDWDQALEGAPRASRLISALRFDRVLSCKSRNIDMAARDKVLDLVGIEFYQNDPPGGSAILLFSDGGALRLDVECVECELADLGLDGFGTGDPGDDVEQDPAPQLNRPGPEPG